MVTLCSLFKQKWIRLLSRLSLDRILNLIHPYQSSMTILPYPPIDVPLLFQTLLDYDFIKSERSKLSNCPWFFAISNFILLFLNFLCSFCTLLPKYFGTFHPHLLSIAFGLLFARRSIMNLDAGEKEGHFQ